MDNASRLHHALYAQATGRQANAALEAGGRLQPALAPFAAARDLVDALTSDDDALRTRVVGPVLALYQKLRTAVWAALLTLAFWRGILSLRRRVASKLPHREERTALILETFYDTAAHAQSPGHLWLDTRKLVFRALTRERLRQHAHAELVDAAQGLGLVDVVSYMHDRGEAPAHEADDRVEEVRGQLIAAGLRARDAEAVARLEVLGENSADTVALFYPNAPEAERARLILAVRRARTRAKRLLHAGLGCQLGLPGVGGGAFLSRALEGGAQ